MAKFQKGVSGNPNGRPKGVSNRSMTLEDIQEYLAKGDKFAMDTILSVMADEDSSATTKLKAALEWLGFDIKVREEIQKRAAAHELEKLEKESAKKGKVSTPILSFSSEN